MIKTSIRNFFRSLGFYFIPLGVTALIVVLYVSAKIPEAISIVKGTFEAIAVKVSGTSSAFDWNAAQPILVAKFNSFIANPENLAQIMSDPGVIVSILKDTAMEVFALESLSNEVTQLITDCVSQLSSMVLVLLVLIVLSIFIGFVLLRVLLQKFLTDANIFKAIGISILDGIIFVALLLLLYSIPNVAAWIVGILFGIIWLLLSLVEAWLFYGVKKVKFTKIFNVKTILTLLLADLIVIALGGGLVALSMLIPNKVSSIYVALPFVELVICLVSINAYGYASKVAGEAKIDKKIETEVNKQIEKKEQ